MNTNALAADLAAIAHQHYVTPDTLDQGVSEALVERIQEKLKLFEEATDCFRQMMKDCKSGSLDHSRDTILRGEAALDELQKAVET